MKDFFSIVFGLLGFMLVLLVIQFVFDPKAAQESLITFINVAANVYHAAINAFSR